MPEPKEGENQTPIENVQLEETNTETGDDTPKTEVSEEKVYTQEEIRTLKKKADDFDGLVEKQRIAKLNKKENIINDDGEVSKKLEELTEKLNSIEKEKAENNLVDAYKDFVKEIPWAAGEEYFNKISENFNVEGNKSKDEILSKLRATTISLFPDKYSEQKEKEIKAKVLAENININNGNGGSSNTSVPYKEEKNKTEEELLRERLGSLLRKNMTWVKK